jgi:hypothetical protein
MSGGTSLKNFRVEAVLRGLHGFQRDAVEHAFDRLFTAPDSSRRFLIADEVGLGKTMIAKGIIARAIEHLYGKVNRLDIVYICSNLGIARQNINRLNPLPDHEFPNAERITLLPLHLRDLREGDVNLISFTPGTSLDLKNNLGTRRERLLLATLLERVWSLRGTGPLNVLQGGVTDTEAFRQRAKDFSREFRTELTESASLIAGFATELGQAPQLKERFLALCDQFGRTRKHIPDDERKARNRMVGELRGILARTCIAALEPDLIILDEFQRFKELLDADSEAGELAQQLFQWSSDHARAHVLLLSATPYKPYTLQHEAAEDDHYRDFTRTLEFLHNEMPGCARLTEAIQSYRHELLRASDDSGVRLQAIKSEIEVGLRKVMSRTERLVAAGEQNGMLRSVVRTDLPVRAEDLRSYVDLKRLGDAVDVDDPIEYWKSAAYAVNFMEGYQLKQSLQAQVDAGEVDHLSAAIDGFGDRQLPVRRIAALEPIGFPNAKLRWLVDELEAHRAFDLLWVPPSLPTYQLPDAYAAASASGVTKRLVFSAWNMVPRSIATLVTYEAERRAYSGNPSLREQTALLRVTIDAGRPVGMPVLGLLMYPSLALTEACDPREFCRGRPVVPTWAEVLEWATERMRSLLPAGIAWAEGAYVGDETWYWAAPLMIDRAQRAVDTRTWWNQPDLAARWAAGEGDDGQTDPDGHADLSAAWLTHVGLAREYALADRVPTGPAPADLPRVLALAAIGGPANCALRALQALYPEARSDPTLRNAAARIAWAFRSLLNRPQAMAIIRAGQREAPYWQLALEHCGAAGLDSVMTEYAHVMRDSTGVYARPTVEACDEVAGAMSEALTVRTASLTIDELGVDQATRQPTLKPMRMPALFAMRFGSDKADDTQQAVRDSAIRAAFNSPFWPFLLASTSVGQEGLDFHWYCHAIIHWNLPSNPVDVEQREGRIHRFKGHAVRKNVAARWGRTALTGTMSDVWRAAFELAQADAPSTDRGLIPYWLFPLEDGAWIERHVPLYPLSRDEIRYEALKKALGAYRLVFGQPRQDELLAYLLDRVDPTTLKALEKTLRIDLAPPRLSIDDQLTAGLKSFAETSGGELAPTVGNAG